MKDGDIFRWRYKDEQSEHRRAWGRYHCKSQIGVAKNGLLRDTFWGSGSDNASWPYADAERELDLTYLGNFADLEKRPDYHVNYYDAADCVDLSHPNSTRDNFYVRKGARRSRERMRVVVAERIADAERELSHAQWKIEHLRETAIKVETAKDLDKVYL